MKPKAICSLCDKPITDKKDYVIYTTPRHFAQYRIAHAVCQMHYLTTHPQLNHDRGFRTLNSLATTLLLVFLACITAIFIGHALLPATSMFDRLARIPLALGAIASGLGAAYYLGLRIRFYLRYE